MRQAIAAVCVLFTLVLHSGVTQAKPLTQEGESPMLLMLDAMQQLLTGGSEYDRPYYEELRACMDTFDPLLLTSQDAAWQGIINYWLTNGTSNDTWGSYQTQYVEQNATNSDFLNMTVYEPCNYASNVAYYHDATEICARRNLGDAFSLPAEYVDALGKAFSGLGMGSSFMHMSHTELGHQQDNWSVRVLSYLIQQASLAGLPDASPILTDLQPTLRDMTSLEIVDDFMTMYATLPVYEWYNHTLPLDIPDYYLSFAGIFGTILTVAFEPEVADSLIPILAEAFELPQDIYDFITLQYLPEIRNLTANVDLGIIQQTRFVENSLSAAIKLIYAFVWQEERLTDNPMFLNETVNRRGWELLPVINNKLNALNTFDYFEQDFQNGTNIYPGDDWCNPIMPHAKWHLESGVGLLDLAFVGDELYRIITTAFKNSV